MPSLSSSGSTQLATPSPSASGYPSSVPSLRSLSAPSHTSGVDSALSGFDPTVLPAGLPVDPISCTLVNPSPSSSAEPTPIDPGEPTSMPSAAVNAPLTPTALRAETIGSGSAVLFRPAVLSNVKPVVDPGNAMPAVR